MRRPGLNLTGVNNETNTSQAQTSTEHNSHSLFLAIFVIMEVVFNSIPFSPLTGIISWIIFLDPEPRKAEEMSILEHLKQRKAGINLQDSHDLVPVISLASSPIPPHSFQLNCPGCLPVPKTCQGPSRLLFWPFPLPKCRYFQKHVTHPSSASQVTSIRPSYLLSL